MILISKTYAFIISCVWSKINTLGSRQFIVWLLLLFTEITSISVSSVKITMSFSCDFAVFMLLRDQFFQIFIHHNSRCKVLYDSRKGLPRISLKCCYISGLSGSLSSALLVLRNEYRSNQGVWRMSHFLIIPHVHTQLNQVCKVHVNLLFLMLLRGHIFPDISYICHAVIASEPKVSSKCFWSSWCVIIWHYNKVKL
jgi:hypothetical protein